MLKTRPMSIGGPALIAALGPAAWYRYGLGITVTGAGVSQWDDQSGNARHLLQATDTNRPAKQADASILFDGADNYLKANAFALNQPTTFYLCMKQVSWTNGDGFTDGDTLNTQAIFQSSATPSIFLYAGAAAAENTALAVDTYGVVAGVFNGASSVLQVNTTITTGDPGAGNAGGFTLGSAAAGGGQFGNMQVKEVILFASAHDADTRMKVIRYLARVGDVAL